MVEIVVLAMPSQHANADALRELRRIGYENGIVAAVALYREDVEELEGLGIDVVVHLYAGAGEALADRAKTKQIGQSARKTIYLSWDDIASSTVERYQALIERNTKSPKLL